LFNLHITFFLQYNYFKASGSSMSYEHLGCTYASRRSIAVLDGDRKLGICKNFNSNAFVVYLQAKERILFSYLQKNENPYHDEVIRVPALFYNI